MDTSLSLEMIYRMLSPLSVGNKKWLADHLYEDVAKSCAHVHRHVKAKSDAELSAELAGFDDLDMDKYQPLTDEQFKDLVRSKPVVDSVKKWL